jgi:tryptophan-rich sensory protein
LKGFESADWTVIAVAAVSAAAVALIGGLLTEVGPWYESLKFPSWRPPNWLFGPAWTVIFILIASSGVKLGARRTDRAVLHQWRVQRSLERAFFQNAPPRLGIH